MKLSDYMAKEGIAIEDVMKDLEVSVHAVKKWLSGQRTPWPKMQDKIHKWSGGNVAPNDWILK